MASRTTTPAAREALEAYGVRLIRFTNAEVCEELDLVLLRLREALRLPFI